MAPYNAQINTCGHPDKKHHAKGLCANCYHAQGDKRQYRDEYAKSHGRESMLKHRYGITIEEWEALNTKQKGLCAICGQPPRGNSKRLFVDHDHKTGKVRGLLCITCNRHLGWHENTQWCAQANAYLKQHESPTCVPGSTHSFAPDAKSCDCGMFRSIEADMAEQLRVSYP